MTDACGKLFMGTQIQCAQCHNHPFTTIKQNEYWGMAQFFMKVEVGNIKAKTGEPGVSEVASPKRGKNNPLPESAKSVAPKFLAGDSPKMAKADPARPVLAQWLTAAENPYFAKAMVNRTWAQFFGRGFVNPIDDMSPENACSHPALLDALAKEFAASGFDLHHMIRGVCNSQSYQRSTKATAANKNDHDLFSHMSVKVMTPEQLFDSLAKVTGATNSGGGRNAKGVGQLNNREQFVNFFLAGRTSPTPRSTRRASRRPCG